jgi:hypothetical protein
MSFSQDTGMNLERDPPVPVGYTGQLGNQNLPITGSQLVKRVHTGIESRRLIPDKNQRLPHQPDLGPARSLPPLLKAGVEADPDHTEVIPVKSLGIGLDSKHREETEGVPRQQLALAPLEPGMNHPVEIRLTGEWNENR